MDNFTEKTEAKLVQNDNDTRGINANTPPKKLTDDLTEGKLYKFENGEMIELKIDPEELRKVKITDDAIDVAISVQKQMRSVLNGFKPDLTTICSALIKGQAQKPDATKVVADFWLEKAQIAASSINADK